ncbi:hypothetical protein CDD83_2705 [Cordyceps sp. RAO-2017]|nr:hypothetical protein CDD83_2705 [Cordyceps sp. RAO-2017]
MHPSIAACVSASPLSLSLCHVLSLAGRLFFAAIERPKTKACSCTSFVEPSLIPRSDPLTGPVNRSPAPVGKGEGRKAREIYEAVAGVGRTPKDLWPGLDPAWECRLCSLYFFVPRGGGVKRRPTACLNKTTQVTGIKGTTQVTRIQKKGHGEGDRKRSNWSRPLLTTAKTPPLGHSLSLSPSHPKQRSTPSRAPDLSGDGDDPTATLTSSGLHRLAALASPALFVTSQ